MPTPTPDWPQEVAHLRADLEEVLRERTAMLRTMGGQLLDWGPGWSQLALTPGPELAGVSGTVAAGVLAALADCALEVASNSYGRLCLALGLTAHHHAPVAVGTPLRVDAREVAREDRIVGYDIAVRVDEAGEGEGRLVGTFIGRGYRTRRWHVPEDDVPAAWRDRW